MSNEEYAFALKSTLNEIKNACPDISHSFIFGEGATIIAKDEETNQQNAVQAANAIDKLNEQANEIGGIKTITIQTETDRVNIASTNDFYSVMISNVESEESTVNTINQVLIPTVLKITDKISKETLTNNFTEVEAQPELKPTIENEITEALEPEEKPQEPPEEENVTIDEEIETEPETEPEIDPDLFLPEPRATQFMIENLSGLLVSSDRVEIDNAVVLQWEDSYENKEITEVDIETLTGQTIRCKYKPIKDKKENGKGVIKMPKKIQLELQAHKGELVMVKPVVE
jgi:hypothetical protein